MTLGGLNDRSRKSLIRLQVGDRLGPASSNVHWLRDRPRFFAVDSRSMPGGNLRACRSVLEWPLNERLSTTQRAVGGLHD